MGANKIATVVKKTIPLKSAYKEENIFAEELTITDTGPMPVKIIDAL